MPRSYVRDLAIAAVICFTGGVGLTLLAVLIYYRVSQRKKQRERERLKEEDERSAAVIGNHVGHLDPRAKRDVFLQTSGKQQFEGKAVMMDTRVENHGGHFRPRTEEDGSHFRCSECAVKQQRGEGPNQMRWSNGINRAMEVEEEMERRRMRIVTEEEKRKPRTHKGILSMDVPDRFLTPGNSNSVSYPGREAFNERPEIQPAFKTDASDTVRTEHKTFHCESCHRTYRAPEQTMRPGRNHTYMRDSEHRMTDRERSIYHKQLDMMMTANRDFRRESRKNVTFDLEGLRNLEQGHVQGEDHGEEKTRSSRHKEKGRKKKQLKAKLNLSPLRKNKVHPKRKHEQGHGTKKSKENRRDGEEREAKEGRTKSSKKTKESSEKTKKSTDSKKEDKDGNEQETTSKSERGAQEETAPAQEENTNPGNTNSAEQQTLSSATGQGHTVQAGTIQYQGAGMVLRNHAANLSLLGSNASRLTGSSLSLQGGNMLLNSVASGSRSVAPGIAISGPNLASSGVLGGFGRQPGAGIISPASSLLANVAHANSLQPSGMQVGGLSTALAANPGIIPSPSNQSQLTPDSSAVVAPQMNGPAQGSGLQKGEGPHQTPAESQAPQTKNSLPMQTQAPQSKEGSSGVTNQVLGLVTPVENLSANNGQTGTGKVPDGSSLNGGNGGPVVGAFGDSMEVANQISGSGVSVSAQSGPSTGGADGTTALLQQEYVSEEGASSPRRKLRLVLPEKTSSREPTALERKIR